MGGGQRPDAVRREQVGLGQPLGSDPARRTGQGVRPEQPAQLRTGARAPAGRPPPAPSRRAGNLPRSGPAAGTPDPTTGPPSRGRAGRARPAPPPRRPVSRHRRAAPSASSRPGARSRRRARRWTGRGRLANPAARARRGRCAGRTAPARRRPRSARASQSPAARRARRELLGEVRVPGGVEQDQEPRRRVRGAEVAQGAVRGPASRAARASRGRPVGPRAGSGRAAPRSPGPRSTPAARRVPGEWPRRPPDAGAAPAAPGSASPGRTGRGSVRGRWHRPVRRTRGPSLPATGVAPGASVARVNPALCRELHRCSCQGDTRITSLYLCEKCSLWGA